MKKCTNANCTKLIIRKNVSKHALYQCDYRSIRCQSCSLLYRADPLLKHCPDCKGLNGVSDKADECYVTREQMSFWMQRIKQLETKDEKLTDSENEITALNKKVEEQERLIKCLQVEIQTLKQNTTVKKPNPNVLLSDIHVWKINQFMKKRNQALSNYYSSNFIEKYFYTTQGQKLEVTLYFNGVLESVGKSLSIGFKTLKGAFDDSVT
ncbi:TNF receptor-associated factor 2-like [Clytia hemisphaerica]